MTTIHTFVDHDAEDEYVVLSPSDFPAFDVVDGSTIVDEGAPKDTEEQS